MLLVAREVLLSVQLWTELEVEESELLMRTRNSKVAKLDPRVTSALKD